MNETRRLICVVGAVLGLLACGPVDGALATGEGPDAADLIRRARAIHDRVLVLDAHADIEIPGKPSPYVGADGLSRVAPAKPGPSRRGVQITLTALRIGVHPI